MNLKDLLRLYKIKAQRSGYRPQGKEDEKN